MSLFLALLIIFSWLAHLFYLLTAHLSDSILIFFHLFLQTFLSTGLFITTHDCIHGLISKDKPWLNKLIGQTCSFLYAGFSYHKLKKNHLLHHQYPAQAQDPDYTNYKSENIFGWAFSFIYNYYGWKEFLIMHLHIGVTYFISQSIGKVLLFYAIPAWLSSMQLFYFGTYLPHREFSPKTELPARSLNFNYFISLITCYHFCYHREHHLRPDLTWWQLPGFRKANSKHISK